MILNYIIKLFSSIRNNGINETLKKIKKYIKNKKYLNIELDKTFENSEIGIYDSEYQEDIDFSEYNPIIKTIAFYLPQFHKIPENDKWWGEGFTEWTNTRRAEPKFKDHYQPREPHDDIGYYDLCNTEVLKKQVELADKHGIYGFCFYYYWFSGHRLLEKPVDILLSHSEINIKFCLCWANENWTRTWDGKENDILIKQKYMEDDPYKFICDIKKYTDDQRYIRIDNKPVIIVYNPCEIINVNIVFRKWRIYAKEIGIGEILIWTCRTGNYNEENYKFSKMINGEIEFPPNNINNIQLIEENSYINNKKAYLYNYQKLVEIKNKNYENLSEKKRKLPLYRCVMLGWDNSARRENEWTTFINFSLNDFYKWINLSIKDSLKNIKKEERFIFINAWNEWGEGTYLEPDKKYGYSNINTLSKAIYALPFNDKKKVINRNENIEINNKLRIAIQVHLFYIDIIDEIIVNLLYIPFKFDCYITTDTIEKSIQIKERIYGSNNINLSKLVINIYKNKGRDIAPFLVQFSKYFTEYDYFCHIHTKKTFNSEYGDDWRKYLYKHILGSSENIKGIINLFETDPSLGIVFPENYPVIEKQVKWSGNKDECKKILEKLGIKYELPNDVIFPVGNMFWARIKAVPDIFTAGYSFDDFQEENDQINSTLAHQIERIWVYIAQNNGFNYLKTYNNALLITEIQNIHRIIFFVHYNNKNIIESNDVESIIYFSKLSTELIFITNSMLSDYELDKIKPYVFKIIIRKNKGFDFGAWRDAFIQYGYKNLEKFDQLILINNSVYKPIFEMNNIFNKMDNSSVDFWGITLFPEFIDGTYLKKNKIKEHIQSYFQVFNKNVFTSKRFQDFWKNVKNMPTKIKVIERYESKLTSILVKAGYKYSVTLPETRFISKYLKNYSILYTNPYAILILGSPFIKKKSENYLSLKDKNKLKYLLSQF